MSLLISDGAAILIQFRLAKAAMLHAELASAIDRSRDLCWWGLQRRLGVDPFGQPISGGSGAGSSPARKDRADSAGADSALVSAMISGVTLCLDCIAKKTGVPLPKVDAVLTNLGRTVQLVVEPGVCDVCLQLKRAYRFARSN